MIFKDKTHTFRICGDEDYPADQLKNEYALKWEIGYWSDDDYYNSVKTIKQAAGKEKTISLTVSDIKSQKIDSHLIQTSIPVRKSVRR